MRSREHLVAERMRLREAMRRARLHRNHERYALLHRREAKIARLIERAGRKDSEA